MKTVLQRLSLSLQFGEDLVVVNKPAGISTHASDPHRPGMVELVQKELVALGAKEKLHVVHRLDKTTTGTLVFASSEKKARELFELFKNHQIKKRYVLLTSARPDFSEITIFSKIEKSGKLFVNTPCSRQDSNCETVFKRVKLNAFFQQWEAFPKTGKPHQIRLHAAQAGLPILGDTIYGGEPYPHLCLHANSIEIPGMGSYQTFHPIFFERMGLLRDRKLVAILSALDRRQRLFNFLNLPKQALRLSHLDQNQFRMDLFGDLLWVYWYDDTSPQHEDLERFEFLQGLLDKKITIRKMQNRGLDPQAQLEWKLAEIENTLTCSENGLVFDIRLMQGLSPGLFLDQRENRHWLYLNSEKKKVLNLFAYTCGFSVAAAAGGADQVVSVDLNKNFLEWGKKNFQLNQLEVKSEQKKYLFFTQDAVDFLKQTVKKNKLFDTIILDPPSFSRNGKNIWRIEKDFANLLSLAWSCLGPGGTILCSSNFEKWQEQDVLEKIQEALEKEAFSIETPSFRPLDFEWAQESILMKSFLIKREK